MGSWWQLTPKSSIVQRTFFVSMALITGSCFLPHREGGEEEGSDTWRLFRGRSCQHPAGRPNIVQYCSAQLPRLGRDCAR